MNTPGKPDKRPKDAAMVPSPAIEPENVWKRIPTKGFLLTCALIVILPLAYQGIRNHSLSSAALTKLIIVEGEKPVESNFFRSPGLVVKNPRHFGGRSLELDTPTPPSGRYFARYEFEIPEEDDYNVYLAGTPPGPIAIGSKWHSPYSVSIDGGGPKLLTEEILKLSWPYLFAFSYVKGGYYFTQIAAAHLKRGTHSITIEVNRGRINDGHFTVYLDALIIAPKNLKPESNVGKIPKDLFYE